MLRLSVKYRHMDVNMSVAIMTLLCHNLQTIFVSAECICVYAS